MITKLDLQKWFKDDESLGIKIPYQVARELVKRNLRLPAGVTAVSIKQDEDDVTVLSGFAPKSGFNLMLVKTNEFDLEVEVLDLKSSDSHPLTAKCICRMAIVPKLEFLKDFVKKIFHLQGILRKQDLYNIVSKGLREVVIGYTTQVKHTEISNADCTKELATHISLFLERKLFDVGIRFTSVTKLIFTSTDSVGLKEGFLESSQSKFDASTSLGYSRRIFIALGNKVISLEFPKISEISNILKFPSPLRSIKIEKKENSSLLLAGSKKSLFIAEESSIIEYRLPDSREPETGVNSSALHKNKLFATHSEYGLITWNIDKPSNPEILFEKLTSVNKTTRCLEIADGNLYFATGQNVYMVNLAVKLYEPLEFHSELESPLTSLAVYGETIFAGTESGVVISWERKMRGKPSVVLCRKGQIISLRVFHNKEGTWLYYTCRDSAVHGRLLEKNIEITYESAKFRCGIMDIASNIILSSDMEGTNLIIWDINSSTQPLKVLNLQTDLGVDKPLVALFIEK